MDGLDSVRFFLQAEWLTVQRAWFDVASDGCGFLITMKKAMGGPVERKST